MNCVSIASDNGLSPVRRRAIIWSNTDLLSIRTLGTNFSEIRFKIQKCPLMKMHYSMSSVKWRPFCAVRDTLRSEQDGQHFANKIFKCISWIKSIVFWFKLHTCGFLRRILLIICQHWLMRPTGYKPISKLECGTWYHHPLRLECVLSRNLRIFKLATWHYRCRHNLKNNSIWDNLHCCLLVPRSPSKPVRLTFDL